MLLGANWEHWGCSWRGGWDGGASSKLRPSTPPGAALGGKASLSPPQEHQGGDSRPCCPQHGAGHTQGCPTAAPILPRVAGSGSVPRTPCHLHRVPSLGMALSSFFSITHAKHGAECSQLLLAIPKMWICPVGISMPTHSLNTHGAPMARGEHPLRARTARRTAAGCLCSESVGVLSRGWR